MPSTRIGKPHNPNSELMDKNKPVSKCQLSRKIPERRTAWMVCRCRSKPLEKSEILVGFRLRTRSMDRTENLYWSTEAPSEPLPLERKACILGIVFQSCQDVRSPPLLSPNQICVSGGTCDYIFGKMKIPALIKLFDFVFNQSAIQNRNPDSEFTF